MVEAHRHHGSLILVNRAGLPTRYGSFRIVSFAGGGQEHVALVKGHVAGARDVLVRVHSECLTADVFRILGVRSVRLMTNNPRKISELQRHGIPVTKRIPLEMKANATNRGYLRTKREKLAHLIE